MNQMCRVCGEPAAGFHFGAFTCEGCKSFFGRTHSNLSQMSDCKNGGNCAINRKNRTSCKACRLRKCLTVGMSKSGSRYGRRSNWFKIHCLLQGQTEGGSSEHEHDGDEASSGRSVSSPDSIKSRHSPHDWKSSVSPDHINDRDEKPDLGKHHMAPFINPFFPNGSLLFHPGMLPMPPAYHMASRDSGMDLEQMQSDLVRWVVACQTQTGSGIVGQNGLPRMPYSPTLAERKVVRPQSPPMLVRKRPFSSVVELEQDQPLDLSAKRGKFYRDDQEDGSRGMSPKSSTSEDEPEDEQPDLREHFRLCNGRSTVLDLSRK